MSPRGSARGIAFDTSRYDWPVPPDDAEPVPMRALVAIYDTRAGRRVPRGDTFEAQAERAYTYVVLGMAVIATRPAWWPEGTPTDPRGVRGAGDASATDTPRTREDAKQRETVSASAARKRRSEPVSGRSRR